MFRIVWQGLQASQIVRFVGHTYLLCPCATPTFLPMCFLLMRTSSSSHASARGVCALQSSSLLRVQEWYDIVLHCVDYAGWYGSVWYWVVYACQCYHKNIFGQVIQQRLVIYYFGMVQSCVCMSVLSQERNWARFVTVQCWCADHCSISVYACDITLMQVSINRVKSDLKRWGCSLLEVMSECTIGMP